MGRPALIFSPDIYTGIITLKCLKRRQIMAQLTHELIDKDIYRIEDGGVRMFLAIGDNEAMLADTGFGDADVASYIRKNITQKPIFVVNTHADRDHTGANRLFNRIFMHVAEMHRYNDPEMKSLVRPLFDGDVIDLGNMRWKIILTPGHTPGHIMLFEEDRGILLSGDSLMKGPMFMFGEGCSMEALIFTLEDLKKMDLPIKAIYPCHHEYGLGKDLIDEVIKAAKAVLEGRGTVKPAPFDLPTRLWTHNGISFFYGNKDE